MSTNAVVRAWLESGLPWSVRSRYIDRGGRGRMYPKLYMRIYGERHAEVWSLPEEIRNAVGSHWQQRWAVQQANIDWECHHPRPLPVDGRAYRRRIRRR